MPATPATYEAQVGGLWSGSGPVKSMRRSETQTKRKRDGGMDQVAELFISKPKALSSIPTIIKKRK
jgi:hypothetical protein